MKSYPKSNVANMQAGVLTKKCGTKHIVKEKDGLFFVGTEAELATIGQVQTVMADWGNAADAAPQIQVKEASTSKKPRAKSATKKSAPKKVRGVPETKGLTERRLSKIKERAKEVVAALHLKNAKIDIIMKEMMEFRVTSLRAAVKHFKAA